MYGTASLSNILFVTILTTNLVYAWFSLFSVLFLRFPEGYYWIYMLLFSKLSKNPLEYREPRLIRYGGVFSWCSGGIECCWFSNTIPMFVFKIILKTSYFSLYFFIFTNSLWYFLCLLKSLLTCHTMMWVTKYIARCTGFFAFVSLRCII